MPCLGTIAALGATLTLAAADDGRLVIGTGPDFPPFVLTDGAGQKTGFDVEMMQELCRRIARPCDWEATDFDQIIPGVVSGRFDLGVGGIAITPERRRVVDFTRAYTGGGGTDWYVGRPGAPAPEQGVTAVISGTIQEAWVRDRGFAFRAFASEQAALGAVAAGEADLALGPYGDRPDLAALIEGQGLGFLYSAELPDEGVGIAVCDTALRDRLDAGLAAMEIDGTLATLESRWP